MAAIQDLKEDNGDRSSDEKGGVNGGVFDPANVHDMPPDPDENLSAAERARIVSSYLRAHYLNPFLMIAYRVASS
jgi:hypothetical protein